MHQALRCTTISLGLLLCTAAGQAHAQVPRNVLNRVLMIRAAGTSNFGTGFTLDIDARQYLITAKHVVATLGSDGVIEIHKAGDHWDPVTVKIFRCDDPIDIAVLAPPNQLTPTLQIEPTSRGIFFGQDAYFVGFPYGLSTDVGQTVNEGFPVAFLKKGIISSTAPVGGTTLIFLDGHNNPGFSGGPIVFRDLNRSDVVFKVAGVVQGFRPETTPVLKPEKIRPEDPTPEDKAQGRIMARGDQLYRLNDTGDVVQLNTGIVVGYAIEPALDLIRQHPIGPAVSH